MNGSPLLILQIVETIRFENLLKNTKADCKPKDCKCSAFGITASVFKQIRQQLNNRKHNLNFWKLTLKYCFLCGVFAKFLTTQLSEAHTSSISEISSQKQVKNK